MPTYTLVLNLFSKMKRFFLPMMVVGLLLPRAEAAIINCPTCSQDDFEHAYYVLSNPGDTIVLPAGAATWGNSSRGNAGVIYIITNVNVVGQGDSTVITLDDTGRTYAQGVIACWAAATFSHFKIVGSNVNPVTAFYVSGYNNPTTGINFTGGFRLTDITYVGGTSDAYFAYTNDNVLSGVIDHCRLTGNTGSAELIFGRGPTDAWQTNSTLGGANNIFIEDCTFNNTGYVCDANSNARYVVRFNTINGSNKVDGHGVSTNSPARSVRHMEVYGNHFTFAPAATTALEIRGGTGMFFDNISDNTNGAGGAWFYLTDYGALGLFSNFAFVFQVPTSFYPIADQIGVGKDPKVAASEPAYVWNNKKNGAAWTRTFEFVSDFTCSTDATGYPIGATSITLQSIPSAMYPGNGVAFAGDNNRYFVQNILTASGSPVTLQLAAPGLLQAIPAAATTVSMGPTASYQKRSGNPFAVMNDAVVIQSNRDFFADAGFDTNTGVSRGTKAAMLAFTPSVVGYGWWVTDEASWNTTLPANTSGQLYTWNGSTWALKYTPYIYPHPLVSGGSTVVAPSGRTISVLVH